MSEWTDADVERVSDALNTITRGGLHDPLGLARALLASGVVVPARVVEEAERAGAEEVERLAAWLIERTNEPKGSYGAVDAAINEIERRGRERADWKRWCEAAEAELSRFRSAVEALAVEWDAVAASLPAPSPTAAVRSRCAEALRVLLTEGRDRAGEGAGS